MSNRQISGKRLSPNSVTLVRNIEVPASSRAPLKITKEINGLPVESQKLSARSQKSTKSTDSSKGVPGETVPLIKDRITKQLNFPLDDNIYKELVPVNVNDSIRELPPPSQRAMHRKYMQNMKHKKRDPEPELNDFLTEIEPLPDVYPKFKIDTSINLNRLPKLPRNNLDKINEIYVKISANY